MSWHGYDAWRTQSDRDAYPDCEDYIVHSRRPLSLCRSCKAGEHKPGNGAAKRGRIANVRFVRGERDECLTSEF